MSDRTQVLSVHRLRRTARKRERELQAWLERFGPTMPMQINNVYIPRWARGVRVEKAGPFQYAVTATEHAGH